MTWWRINKKSKIKVGACTDVGQVRRENQDAFGRFPLPPPSNGEDQLFIVADGMGGHAGGREASQLAVQVVPEMFFSGMPSPVPDRLKTAFMAANERIYTKARSEEAYAGMGTTCTALALVRKRLHLAHVGDSRAYRINGEGIAQLTHDHTLVEEMRREGVLTEEEARNHPRRNTLTRAMGVDSNLQVDVLDIGEMNSDDCYLLCSDGLAKVSDEEIVEVLAHHPPQRACEVLVEMANQRGGLDNVTVMVIKFE